MMTKSACLCAVVLYAPASGGIVAYCNWEPVERGPILSYVFGRAPRADRAGFNFVSLASGGLESVTVAATTLSVQGRTVEMELWTTGVDGTPDELLVSGSMLVTRGVGGRTHPHEVLFDGGTWLEAGTTYSLVMHALPGPAWVAWGAIGSVAETLVERTGDGDWLVKGQDPSDESATMAAHVVVTPGPGVLAALGGAGLLVSRRRR